MVSVVGDAGVTAGSAAYEAARAVGRCLVEADYRVCCGGLGGVMTAVFEGARQARNYREGDTVGVIPMLDRTRANRYADIVIATGMGHARNVIVANGDAMVVIGGGAGTLSEAALAWTANRLIVALPSTGGTAERIAGTVIDHRPRGDGIAALRKVWAAETPEDAVALLNRHLPDCQVPPHEFRPRDSES